MAEDDAPGGLSLDRAWELAEKSRGARWAFPELDPARTALVAVDLTRGRLSGGPRFQPIVTKLAWIADVLRPAGGRVCWVAPGGRRPGPRQSEPLDVFADDSDATLSPDLPRHRRDMVLRRPVPSAFFPGASTLPHLLRGSGVDTVILAGLYTTVAVDASARDAAQGGFRVVVAADACAGDEPQAHAAALFTLHRHFADVRPSADIVAVLQRNRARRESAALDAADGASYVQGEGDRA